MYTDVVVLAGVGTVGLMIAFMGALGYFFVKDAKKRSGLQEKK